MNKRMLFLVIVVSVVMPSFVFAMQRSRSQSSLHGLNPMPSPPSRPQVEGNAHLKSFYQKSEISSASSDSGSNSGDSQQVSQSAQQEEQSTLTVPFVKVKKSIATNNPSYSFGALIDEMYAKAKTKVKDKFFGYASNVLEDILNDHITSDTDGLHRIDRAIDDCIEAYNCKLLDIILVACLQKEIPINDSHLAKSKQFIKKMQQEHIATLQLIQEMRTRTKDKDTEPVVLKDTKNINIIENHL